MAIRYHTSDIVILIADEFLRGIYTSLAWLLRQFQNIPILAFILLFNLSNKINRVVSYMYNNCYYLRLMINMLDRFVRKTYRYVFGIVEIPENTTWISLSSMDKLSKSEDVPIILYWRNASFIYKLFNYIFEKFNHNMAIMNIRYSDEYAYHHDEEYFGLGDDWNKITEKMKRAHDYNESEKSIGNIISEDSFNEDDGHILTIVRNNDMYCVRVSADDSFITDIDRLITISMCPIRFIVIEYIHPRMTSPITIELPMGIYIVGNNILSSVFVLRWLVGNIAKNSYIFDMDYKLRIMDNNIKYVELNSNQYCVFTENNWYIDKFVSPNPK